MSRFALVFVLSGIACGQSPDPAPDPTVPLRDDTLIADPSMALPEDLEDVGLYLDSTDLERVHPRAVKYRPAFELWSNGSDKARFIVVPEAEAVATADPAGWEFPQGTLLFKTFSYPTEDGAALRPVETRVLKLEADGWQYGVYVWDKAGRSATLGDLSSTVPVPVRIEDEHFEHVIPAKLDCRKCHESADHAVLGFSELQLNAPFGESDRSQLDALTAAGVLDAAPESAAAIVHSDPLTREALGYLTGNCVHCHNGGDGPSSAFDLRHAAAIDNLVDQPAEGELATGVRVVPGHPERSVLFRALRRDLEDLDVQPMPPVGVDRVDQGALDLFEAWIRSLATN